MRQCFAEAAQFLVGRRRLHCSAPYLSTIVDGQYKHQQRTVKLLGSRLPPRAVTDSVRPPASPPHMSPTKPSARVGWMPQDTDGGGIHHKPPQASGFLALD